MSDRRLYIYTSPGASDGQVRHQLQRVLEMLFEPPANEPEQRTFSEAEIIAELEGRA